MSINAIFVLLVFFQVKHFLADYPLQGRYMLGKFRPGWDFVLPLAAHCAVHSLFDLSVLLYLGRMDLWWLALVDFVVHFVMDRLKAGPKYLGRFESMTKKDGMFLSKIKNLKPYRKKIVSNTIFWWSLGFDQMVHHLTDLYIVYVIVTM